MHLLRGTFAQRQDRSGSLRRRTQRLNKHNRKMNTYRNRLRAATVVAVLALWPFLARPVGFRLPNQDPEAIARGNAFVATADNPSAIYYNPAGITQIDGQEVRAGVYVVSPGYQYEGPYGDAKASSTPEAVPQLYYVFSPEGLPLSFGLGVYAPYGLSLDWGKNTPLSTIAQRGDLLYATVNPVVAWKITKTLSVGVGPTINYSSARLESAIGLMPGDEFKLNGSGWAYGFNAGIRWEPLPQWAFGINYRSETTVDYHGTSETLPSPPYPPDMSSTSSIKFPQFVVGGISFRPTPLWNIEFDLDWADWGAVKQIPIQGTAFGNTALPLNYRSSFMYELGATRQLCHGYFVSLGYFYSESSSPSKDFNPIIPDTNLHLGGVGFGHKGRRFDWAVAYQFGYNPGRTVTGDQGYPLANGTYRVFNNAVNLAATFKF
jgi:long-chain fatty acid transport protein